MVAVLEDAAIPKGRTSAGRRLDLSENSDSDRNAAPGSPGRHPHFETSSSTRGNA